MDVAHQNRRRAAAATHAQQMIARIAVAWPNIPVILDRWSAFVGQELAVPDSTETLLEYSIRSGRDMVKTHTWETVDDRLIAVAFVTGMICAAENVRYLVVTSPAGAQWDAAQGPFTDWRAQYPGELIVTQSMTPACAAVETWLITDTDRRVLGHTFRQVMDRAQPERSAAPTTNYRSLAHDCDGG